MQVRLIHMTTEVSPTGLERIPQAWAGVPMIMQVQEQDLLRWHKVSLGLVGSKRSLRWPAEWIEWTIGLWIALSAQASAFSCLWTNEGGHHSLTWTSCQTRPDQTRPDNGTVISERLKKRFALRRETNSWEKRHRLRDWRRDSPWGVKTRTGEKRGTDRHRRAHSC